MESLSRPEPNGPFEQLRRWLGWFGVGRLVASAIAVVVVCVGAFWLVRTSPPPTEASLPRVTAADTTTVTLPPPVAVVTDAQPGPITVHVAGAVIAPGVYQLLDGDRVHDAVRVAGGATDDAVVDALNLAAPVVDGSRIYVPIDGEAVPAPVGVPLADPSAPAPSGPIDVNRATASQLDALPGVGPATSVAIVDERERNGPFLTVDDLERVSGIGPATIEKLRDLVTT